MLQVPVYQIDFSAVAAGKHVASTKRRIKWRFGYASEEALRAGGTGIECRGEEHEVVVTWSVNSGKRQIMMDGKEVHYSLVRSSTLEHSWSTKGNHVIRLVCYAAPPTYITPGTLFRQYDLAVDGRSFFSMPKVYELGVRGNAGGGLRETSRSTAPEVGARVPYVPNPAPAPAPQPAPAPPVADQPPLMPLDLPPPPPQADYGQPLSPAAYGQPPPYVDYGQLSPQPDYGQLSPQAAYGQPSPLAVYGQSPTQAAFGQPSPQAALYGQQIHPQAAYGQQPTPVTVPPQTNNFFGGDFSPTSASAVPATFDAYAGSDPFAPQPPAQQTHADITQSILGIYAAGGAPAAPPPQLNIPSLPVTGNQGAVPTLGFEQEESLNPFEAAMKRLVNVDRIDQPAELHLEAKKKEEDLSEMMKKGKSKGLPPAALMIASEQATLAQISQVKGNKEPKKEIMSAPLSVAINPLGQQQGMMGQQPGMMGQQSGMMGQQPGMMGQQPGMMGQQPGMMGQQPGMMGQAAPMQQQGFGGGLLQQGYPQSGNGQPGGFAPSGGYAASGVFPSQPGYAPQPGFGNSAGYPPQQAFGAYPPQQAFGAPTGYAQH